MSGSRECSLALACVNYYKWSVNPLFHHNWHKLSSIHHSLILPHFLPPSLPPPPFSPSSPPPLPPPMKVSGLLSPLLATSLLPPLASHSPLSMQKELSFLEVCKSQRKHPTTSSSSTGRLWYGMPLINMGALSSPGDGLNISDPHL